jgi:hypothetical protein
MRTLIRLALAAAFLTTIACAPQAQRAKTGLSQAGKELGTAADDAGKNVDYTAKDAKKEVKGGKKKDKED